MDDFVEEDEVVTVRVESSDTAVITREEDTFFRITIVDISQST